MMKEKAKLQSNWPSTNASCWDFLVASVSILSACTATWKMAFAACLRDPH